MVIIMLLIALLFPSTAGASDADKGEVITLSRDKIIELAEKNYLAVQQQHLQTQLDAAQLRYSEGQRKAIGTYESPIVHKLPATLEELRALVPGYSEMTEEEKLETDAALMVQAMINASMNGMLEAQAEYQYVSGVQQWRMQIDALDEQISNGTYSLKIAKLEQQKMELAAQFYALQSYYGLVGLQSDIKEAQFEAHAAKTALADVEMLYRAGLSTKSEVEQAQKNVKQQEQQVNNLMKQQDENILLFKQDLGIKKKDSIILPDLEKMKADKNYDNTDIDIKKQLDHIKAEEAIIQAKVRYGVAKSDNPLLADYLNTLMVVETERKAATDQWLEQRIVLLEVERERILEQVAELEGQYGTLVVKQNDYKKLFSIGSISEREVEAVVYDLTKLKFALEKVKLQYAIWQEKKRIAVLGVLQ